MTITVLAKRFRPDVWLVVMYVAYLGRGTHVPQSTKALIVYEWLSRDAGVDTARRRTLETATRCRLGEEPQGQADHTMHRTSGARPGVDADTGSRLFSVTQA